MYCIKKLAFIVSCMFVPFYVFSQSNALNVIDQHDLKQHLTYIASDDLKGRALGANDGGLEKTAQYIAENAQKIGLIPPDGSYFQNVGLRSVQPDENSFVEVKTNKGKSVYKSNTLINLNNAEFSLEVLSNEIVMAGFGGDEAGHFNLKNKVVIVALGNAEMFKTKDNFRWNNQLERSKISVLSKELPKCIVIVTSPYDKENKTFNQVKAWFNRRQFQLETFDQNNLIPTIVVTPDFADALLGGKGKYRRYLIQKNNENVVPLEYDDGVEVRFEVKINSQQLAAKNVIGFVEGSDPKLKEECLVFMAHYDHLGVDKNEDVFNGADDNGSGTVTLMEVAEAFSSLEKKPKRSILFLWVTGEEVGMLGSKYYVEHPVFPINNTIACFNIDMDGRVFEAKDTIWKNSPKMVKDFDGLFTLTNNVWPELKMLNDSVCELLGLVPDYSLPETFLRTSDHYSFHKKGVPVLNYATGYHADYHKVTDEVSKINFDKIKRVADLCFLMGFKIANLDPIEKE